LRTCAGDESSFDGIAERHAELTTQPVLRTQPVNAAEPMSVLTEQYLAYAARERGWPTKTVLRKRGELREFLEIVAAGWPCENPVDRNAIRRADIRPNLAKNI
jgi:hypothetical protein